MIEMLVRHLCESTLVCLLLIGISNCFRGHAAALRHTLLFTGAIKFLLPTILLSIGGAHLAQIVPSGLWFPSAITRLLAGWLSLWPTHLIASRASMASLIFLAIWAIGSMILLSRCLLQLRVPFRNLSPPNHLEIAALHRAQSRLGMRTSTPLHISDDRLPPALIGVLRPRIILPPGLAVQTELSELEAIFAHELTHQLRRDNLRSALVHLVRCLFWFHPLLWFLENRLAAERERACDESVLSSGISAAIYLGALIKVCHFELSPSIVGISAAAASNLEIRFARILAGPPPRTTPYLLSALLTVVAVLLAALPVAGGYCQQCVANNPDITRQHSSVERIR